jgi:diaminopimelate decarboxylase
VGIDVCSPG